MECKLDLKSYEDFSLFNDSLYFSHDGNYIFALLANVEGKIIKAIVMKSDDLSMPETNEIDLSQYNIMGKYFIILKILLGHEIEGTPSLIWGHKDSFGLEYARRSDRITDIGSFT